MKKGFTLIELIIVIAVIAVLGTTVIIVLNPARILAEARDSQRIADLEQLKKVMVLYIGLVNGPEMITTEVPNQPVHPEGGNCTCTTPVGGCCFVHGSAGVVSGADGCAGTVAGPGPRHGSLKDAVLRTNREVNGVGWIPVDFENMSTGAALAVLPIDPRNNDPYFYTYACQQSTPSQPYFEFTSKMESVRFSNGGGNDDVESKDSGNNNNLFETGNFPGLSL